MTLSKARTERSIAPGSSARQFGADLVASIVAWRRHPWLPLLTFALAVALEAASWVTYRHPHPWVVIGSWVLGAVMAGWAGTQRIWYLRAFTNERIQPSEVVSFTVAFLRRFVLLALVVAAPGVLVSSLLGAFWPDRRTLLSAWLVIPALLAWAIDVGLTFVTPALAYSTRQVSVAVRHGVHMLRQDWPRCAWQALTPPLALVLLMHGVPAVTHHPQVVAVVDVSAFLVGLWLKGAIALYYMRQHEIGRRGSA